MSFEDKKKILMHMISEESCDQYFIDYLHSIVLSYGRYDIKILIFIIS